MADNDPRNTGGRGDDPRDSERTAAHRLGPPLRPMRPGAPTDARRADTGYVDRVTDDGAPVDVAAVRRDDELIEALAAGGAVSTADNTEFALASLLADWRDEIVTTPVPAGPSVDEMVAATERGRSQRGGESRGPSTDGVTPLADAPSVSGRKRNRRFTVIAGSAAAAMALLGGGTVLVNSASPGDGALWSVKEVVFSDAASQTVATSQAKEQIALADREIGASNPSAAESALVSARQQAAKVKNERDRAALEERIRALESQAGLPVGSTDLPPSRDTSAPVTTPVTPTTLPPPETSVNPTIAAVPTEPSTTKPTTSRPTTPKPTTTTPTTTRPTSTSAPATTTTTTPPRTTTRTTAAPPTFTVQRPGQLPGQVYE